MDVVDIAPNCVQYSRMDWIRYCSASNPLDDGRSSTYENHDRLRCFAGWFACGVRVITTDRNSLAIIQGHLVGRSVCVVSRSGIGSDDMRTSAFNWFDGLMQRVDEPGGEPEPSIHLAIRSRVSTISLRADVTEVAEKKMPAQPARQITQMPHTCLIRYATVKLKGQRRTPSRLESA